MRKEKDNRKTVSMYGDVNTAKTKANETRHFAYNDNEAVLTSELLIALFCFI